jgi:2-polyprenyl-6-methoxyphenol hydroxylase-like FAD-dependent oxidoreductase
MVSARAFSDRPSEISRTADILIVGSGMSGTLAATALARAGHDVCLIDRHAVYPPDFRAEHLDGPQIGQLRRLGFLDDLTAGLYRGDTVTVSQYGRTIGTAETINYGLSYETLVNRARSNLPPSAQAVIGRVESIETGEFAQRVRMSDGRVITGRLVVLATGQGYGLCRRIGIRRRVLREAHSLTFGFDIEPAGQSSFPHSFLLYQRERIRDRIDYLAAFTMGPRTRVNLFTYRDYREPWTRAFFNDPDAGLAKILPGMTAVTGPIRVTGPVVARPTDLYVSEDYNRSGVVLIGDAFQSSCPATGMGVVRLLTDIERLCTLHLPGWLATPGMNAAKIAQFYQDPVKRSCDAKALHDAEYRRSVSTETTIGWNLHRARVRTMERLNGWRRHVAPSSNPRIGGGASEPALAPG